MWPFVLLLPSVAGLTAFDCTKSGEVHTFSYEPLGDCDLPSNDTWTTTPWKGTVLQFPEYSDRFHRTCRLELRQYTMYCTFSNNPTQLEMIHDDFKPTTYQLSERECMDAWQYGRTKIQGVELAVIAPGVTKILIGPEIDENGFCKSSRSTSKVLKGVLELEMANVREFATTQRGDGHRSLDGSTLSWNPSGLSSSTLDGIVVLAGSPPKLECNWKVIHSGEGTSVLSGVNKHDLVIQQKTAAFTLLEPINLCGLEVHPTTDPLVYVSNTSGLAIPRIDHQFQGSLNTLLRAGLAGQEFLTKLALGSTTQTILKNQCLLEQMVRTSIVQAARKHPELAALTITGTPGWILYPAGHGVRLKACSEFPVAIVEQTTCHADIPVQLENTTQIVYMDALTKTLLPSSYEIPCTDPTLPIVKVRSTLYTLSPHLTPLPGVVPLQSRLMGLDRSWLAPGDRLYPDEIIFALNRPEDHMSRKAEVERQLIKLGDGSFQQVQDSMGVLPNVVQHVMQHLSTHWVLIVLCVASAIILIINILLLHIIVKLGFWRAIRPDYGLVDLQARLLGQK
ncbi:hypothetical protein 3 [Solanum melongena rhabdo-like virus]|uniref:hypothetical protein 3 n=1 Tax=Solanum melongena rhabdo-like virus TaxID=2740120 RepID=UPI002481CDFF|nr:hypothetical protein 3 [Solanum melongena rhabdo-like virus]QKI29232.1 hypothetical protein 3 [Solanum melongena rhabdo-like virus]